MDQPIRLGFSPCPNDTFIFDALVHQRINSPLSWEVKLDDVETLNGWAEEHVLDVAKVSYHAFGRIAQDWWMLRSGGALGRGVGPLVVACDANQRLEGARIATPGGRTTANLLLDLYSSDAFERVIMRYDEIMPAVEDGRVDAGLIIHESRFTYAEHRLHEIVDLGSWWERTTGQVIPLGGIAVRRSLPTETIDEIARAIRASVEYAFAHPTASEDYVAMHAQEMLPDVRRKHIETYVNEFSLDVGPEGIRAVRHLLEHAAKIGRIPAPPDGLFWTTFGA